MLGPTEFMPLTTGLTIILWIEAIVYLGIGAYELFDDFFDKPQPWMVVNGRTNGYVMLMHKVGHKMHAGLCFLLGFVALNGILEGAVTRFELELIFVSFAVIMPVVLSSIMPGRLGLLMVVLKPEFWLQIAMFVMFSELVRWQVLLLCVLFNCWGIFVYLFHTRRTLFVPFDYETLRSHCVDAVGDERALQFDKLAGYQLPKV